MDPLQRIEDRFPDWNYHHPRILHAMIRSLQPEIVVEVGTYRGYAACYMAQALKENGKGRLYCIDNWSLDDHESRYGPARQHFQSNLEHCEVADRVTVIEGDSDKVGWPDKVDFVYIDGNHNFDPVMMDLICWAPKVHENGLVMLHDYCAFTHAGIMDAVNAYTRCHRIDPWFVTRDAVPTAFWRKEAARI